MGVPRARRRASSLRRGRSNAGAGCSSVDDPDGIDLDEQFGNLWEHLAPWEPERLVVAARHSYEIAANWKLIHENYQECYHCSEIHPELCTVTPPDSGYSIDITGLFVAGPMDLYDGVETMSLDGRSLRRAAPRACASEQLREVGYFGVFPNLLISPHPDYVLTHRLEPLAPDRTLVECEWLFPPEALELDGVRSRYAVGVLGRHEPRGLGGVRVAAALGGLARAPAGPAVGGLGGRRVHAGRDDRRRVPPTSAAATRAAARARRGISSPARDSRQTSPECGPRIRSGA